MNIAIILAGGIGSRVGAGIPKQFIEIFGKPVIIYTLEKFQNHKDIHQILVVCVASYIQKMRELTQQFQITKVKWIVAGGSTFQDSVQQGVNYLENKADPNDNVLVHYGASPFVSEEIISDSIRVCNEKGNCVSATPVFLLMGNNKGDHSDQFIDRDKLMALNSPQAFKLHEVLDLYKEARQKNILDSVEPHTTSLMFALGKTIYFSKGNQTNIKITTKEDLELLKGQVLLQKYKNHEI